MIVQRNRLWALMRAFKLPGAVKRAHQSPSKERFRVVNLTRNTVLARSLEVADTAQTRRKGLLGRESFSPGEGLWIVPCESVHTFSMPFTIDLVYLDSEKRVKKLRSEVVPWRISACLSAHSVLELPAGTICGTRTQCEDRLEFSPLSSSHAWLR